jgi:hypothetical protein
MENQEILEEQWDNTPETMKEKRGTFLLILCILSWIGIGISMISELVTILRGTAAVEKQINDTSIAIDQIPDNNPMSSMLDGTQEMMIKTLENFYEIHIGTVISLLIGLLGVYLMYSLKKAGFYLYLVYCIAGLLIMPMFLGTNWVVLASLILGGVFSVGFVIMYGVNLKRMTE